MVSTKHSHVQSASIGSILVVISFFFVMAVYKDIDVEFEVRTVNGTVLGVFHVRSDLRVKDLRQAIAERTGSCEGSCELIIDNTIAMDFSLVGGISLSKSRVEVTLVRKKPVLVDPCRLFELLRRVFD